MPGITAADAMTESPVSIQRSTSVSKAAELMIEYKIDALPVVDADQQLVGLGPSTDLFVLLIGENDWLCYQALPFAFTVEDAGTAATVA